MSDDQFTKMFRYLQTELSAIRSDLAEKSSQHSVDTLVSTVDGFAGYFDTYSTELAAMDHKVDRLEKYIEVLARKTGVDLSAIHS